MPPEADVIEPEPGADLGSSALVRHPGVPTSIDQLAALKGEAVEIINARATVLSTLRLAAIRATSPEDWLLFKAPDEQGGQVVSYLQDAGCDRIRDLFGIEIYDISRPEKVVGQEPGTFHYLISGSGRCKITRQVVEAMEGGRSSTDDFCKDKTGVDLELAVRKAARANLDGNITRELAGMKSVPLKELETAWNGTNKLIANCRLGRGFGSSRERLGGSNAGAPEVEPPKCGVCGAVAKYRPANDKGPAFYGCPNYQKHADRKWSLTAAKWIAEQQAAAAKASPVPAAAAPAEASTTRPAATPLHADEIFGKARDREPGAEG